MKKIGAFFRCFCPPNWPFLLGVGPFSNIEGLPSPSILARAPQFWQKPPLSTASKMLDQARSPRSSHSPAPQFWQKPLNFGKVLDVAFCKILHLNSLGGIAIWLVPSWYHDICKKLQHIATLFQEHSKITPRTPKEPPTKMQTALSLRVSRPRNTLRKR